MENKEPTLENTVDQSSGKKDNLVSIATSPKFRFLRDKNNILIVGLIIIIIVISVIIGVILLNSLTKRSNTIDPQDGYDNQIPPTTPPPPTQTPPPPTPSTSNDNHSQLELTYKQYISEFINPDFQVGYPTEWTTEENNTSGGTWDLTSANGTYVLQIDLSGNGNSTHQESLGLWFTNFGSNPPNSYTSSFVKEGTTDNSITYSIFKVANNEGNFLTAIADVAVINNGNGQLAIRINSQSEEAEDILMQVVNSVRQL